MRGLRAGAALALALGSLGVGIGAASATDSYPCGGLTYIGPGVHHTAGYAQYCPLTQGSVPVRASRSASSAIVGYLWQGGSVNWFICQWTGGEQYLGAYSNNWWASTEADNGAWGYVSEVYFKGGSNNERDAALRVGSDPVGNGVC